jgi:hypothetical protein
VKVTRVAYSSHLNAGKHAQLVEQGYRLGRVRSEVWQRYGSVSGTRFPDRHYQIDARCTKSSARLAGGRKVGVDKGYTEVLTDSDGERHGFELGALLASESDYRKVKNARRAKLRSVAGKATEAGDRGKAERIVCHNLGTTQTGPAFGPLAADGSYHVSERRGSALTLVNAAYTSQVVPCREALGRRSGDRLHCTRCGRRAKYPNDQH